METRKAGPLRFDIGGMHCAACSSRIERVVGRMENVERIAVNLPRPRSGSSRARKARRCP